MKQTDILSFAINGVARELKEAHEEVDKLTGILNELTNMDRMTDGPVENNSIGRPAEFVPNCYQCAQKPCICGHM